MKKLMPAVSIILITALLLLMASPALAFETDRFTLDVPADMTEMSDMWTDDMYIWVKYDVSSVELLLVQLAPNSDGINVDTITDDDISTLADEIVGGMEGLLGGMTPPELIDSYITDIGGRSTLLLCFNVEMNVGVTIPLEYYIYIISSEDNLYILHHATSDSSSASAMAVSNAVYSFVPRNGGGQGGDTESTTAVKEKDKSTSAKDKSTTAKDKSTSAVRDKSTNKDTDRWGAALTEKATSSVKDKSTSAKSNAEASDTPSSATEGRASADSTDEVRSSSDDNADSTQKIIILCVIAVAVLAIIAFVVFLIIDSKKKRAAEAQLMYPEQGQPDMTQYTYPEQSQPDMTQYMHPEQGQPDMTQSEQERVSPSSAPLSHLDNMVKPDSDAFGDNGDGNKDNDSSDVDNGDGDDNDSDAG